MPRLVTTLGVCAAIAVLAAHGDAAPSGGRVVRVERHATRDVGTPRYCTVSAGNETTAQCSGRVVEAGEIVTVMSESAVIGQLRVIHVTPDQACGQVANWIVEGEWSPVPGAATTNETLGGVVDGGLDPRRAHLVAIDVSPSGRQTDQEFSAIDSDGDGTADLMFDHYACDAQGTPSQTSAAQCFETWTSSGRNHEPRRVRLDIVPQC